MAAAPRLLLWLLLPLLWPPGPAPAEPHPGPSRRFSEHKLCADEECSMLMYRGEALQDFTGPDCRFVNFKKGDPVYVYYKLAGGAPEVWAGSVGRIFGYFPKDLIQIVHEYTKKELQLPTDETDFVCFDGGRDDFDNYNIEELLGSWELYDSAAGDPPGAGDKPAHDPQKPPEVSEESDPEPDPEETDSEEGETLSSEDTRDPEGRFEAQKRSHPHTNDQTDNPQGGWSSLNPFEEMLQERLKVPENENKTSNGSQASHEQEKIGAHKLLKTEVTLDWKTKFGSTADALVSDDETTRLVTSLEDDLDEELDADYDTARREDEEGEDSFDELPLLTFTDEEDTKTPAEPGVEKYSAEGGKKSSKEDLMEVAPPPGIKDDKNTIPTPGGTVFSVVTGSKEKAGMMDLESSESEEEKDDVLLGPDSEWEDASSAMNAPDPELAGDGDLAAEVPETNDRDPGVDPELHAETKGRKIQEYKRGLAPDKTASEDDKKGEVTAHGSAQSSDRDSLLSAEKAKDTFESVFENKGKDPREAAVRISKETLHEEKPDEQILESSAERESGHEAAGNQKEEDMKQDSMDTAAHVRDSQHDASKDGVGDVDVVVRAPGPHVLSVGVQGEQFKKELVLETQNQSRIFTPGETGPPAELEEEVSRQGRNVSRQQERDVAAAAHKHVDENVRVSDGARHGDTSRTEFAYHKTLQGTQVAGNTGQAGSKEVLGSQTGQPEAEGDDDIPEELLEDENALSAKEAKKDSSGVQDGRSGVDLQPPERAASETATPEGETGENKAETGVILETERKSDTVAKGADALAGGPARMEGDKEESSLVGEKTHRPSEVSDSPDTQTVQTSELGDLFRNKDSDGLKEDSPEDQPKTSGFAEKPEVEELSKEDREDLEKFTGPESQWSTSEKLDGDLFHWATGKPEQGDSDKDLPIIRSFFKDQQSLQRFQKYFDVRELEAVFQEMSLKLKSARQETLPYNVEKVLDKVFRASESHILSVAEQMLDSRVAAQRELGIKEDSIFEEAAVLDDIQDLIYFVRYQHSAVEGTVLPVVTRPPEDSWDGPVEGSAEELKMQAPEESGHLDQPVSSDTAASEGTGDMTAPGVSQTPTTEIGSDPEIISREGMPLDVKQQLETNAEESPSATPLEKGLLYVCSFVFRLTATLVATLPDDVQPGPDFYGLPWRPVLITAFLGIVSFAIFFWRTILAVKNRVYQVSEQEITEKLKNIKKENEELKEKLSNYEQKIRESKKHVQETKKQNTILSDEAIKFKDKIKALELNNEVLDEKAKSLHVLLESEREQNVKNQDLILENKKSIEKLKEVIAVNASEFSEVQIALNEAKLSEEKVKSECHRVQEENAKLTKKKEQLQQEIQDWSEAHAGLTEQIKAFQRSQEGLEVALSHKDDSIDALTNCLTQLNRLDCDSESDDKNRGGNGSDELANGETGGDWSEKMKNQIKQMLDVSRTKTAISVVEEDLKLLQIKLRASMSTKCNLEDQIKRLEEEREVLQSTRAGLEDECKTLKQKVEILNELYQQKEMALQKKLSQEEYERQEKEQRLSAADERAVLAAEEVKTYKRRIEEMEDELQKTERSFKSQIAAHEKKAHDNWLKARAAERAIAEEKREAANLRHKLLEITQKMAMLQEEPVIVKPLPGRPNAQNPPRRGPLSQNGSFGPSPVSGGECSPPLTVDPPVRPPSANLSRREMTRGPLDGPPPRPRWPPDAPGKASVSAEAGAGAGPLMNSSSGSSSPKVMDDGKVNMAAKGPPPFPGVPLPPPVRYGPPPQLGGPFGPQPLPPPFAPGLRPPLGLREYAPGIPPGKRDLPLDPREFLPGHTPFRPLGPRAFFIPGTRLPPPPHGPQDYPPLPAARDVLPPGSRDEPPSAAAQSSSQDSSQALKQSP